MTEPMNTPHQTVAPQPAANSDQVQTRHPRRFWRGVGVSLAGMAMAAQTAVPFFVVDRVVRPLIAQGTAQTSGTPGAGVVLINTSGPSGEGAGTGMAIDQAGTILTNYHVVADSSTVEVTDPATGKTATATVIGHDQSADVALLSTSLTLTPVKFDEDGTSVGEQVTSLGNASGGGTLVASSGQVTATDQTIQVSSEQGVATMSGLIETSTDAVPGDSGGPTYDAQGEVVGITSAGANSNQVSASSSAATATSYVIPIATARQIVEKIQSGAEGNGVVIGPKAYLGATVTDLRGSRRGYSTAGGVGVVDVPGPAADAGLSSGDILTSVDGSRLSSTSQLSEVLAAHEPGDVITITYLDASGQSHSGQVSLGENPLN